MNKPYVVTVSIMHMDEYYRMDRWPEVGDKASAVAVTSVPGGSISNMSCVLAHQGTNVCFYDVLSYSRTNDKLLKVMEENGVNVDNVRRMHGMSDSKCLILQTGDERTIIWMAHPKKCPELTPEAKEMMLGAAYVYQTTGIKIIPDRLNWMRSCKEAGVKFAFDMEYALETDEDRAIVELADVLFFNQFGFAACKEGRDDEEYCRYLLDKGVSIIVRTIGTKGSIVTTRDGSVTVPICPVKVVDTNGAGDSYNAAFMHNLLQGKDPVECAKAATRVAAYCVGHMGPRAAAVDPTEIEAWLAEQGA